MYILGNGRIITQDSANPYIENGAIAIKNDKILEISSLGELEKKYPDFEFIDAQNKVIMPGLINTHMHIYSSFARGMKVLGSTRNFDEILKNLWWKVDKNLNANDIKYSALATYIESIKNGVTTVIDHHASPLEIEGSLKIIADVANKLGIRTSLCYEVSDRDGIEIAEIGIKENVDFIKYTNSLNSDMLKGMFGLHASFTLSDETLEKCQNLMKDLNVGYHIHVAEGSTDLTNSLEKYGKRVVERLDKYGIFGEKTIAVHCIHVNDSELDIIEKSGCCVIHNPESNMGNAVGCSPAIKMLEKNILVGLGTDGYTADMLESLKVANIIHKHSLCDPTVGWIESPKMLFENNREIAKRQFGCETGILKTGAKADIVIMDYTPHTEMNSDNLYSHILFGISGKSAITSIINGKLIMRDREFVNLNEKEVFEESRKISKKMWKRLGI
ncbi:putative aminohydrolase SsnA [Cetobacterium sp. 2A]|uniref:putative aminohydrolase SsnA n=1 Tax=Cetobacterium sp. 2A TaxID=2754723 RepID=UPI00163CC4B7|nr:putative aminohydrolase SsnA [Cetobacterium sp. 2A]MBC2854978.1 putative aminohydrolase SsnA [Cetobacterium sp. 2A]